MDKQNVVYPCNEILFRNKKQQATDTYYNKDEPLKNILLSERRQIQKPTYCIIPFI